MHLSIKPSDLKCEYKINPTGIDEKYPRFCWITPLNEYGALQRNYRIIVSSSEQNVSEGFGDIWDSGMVRSPESIQILFGGTALLSNKQYYWKVRVWVNNIPSLWSEPAKFTTGLFNQSDWQAKWIYQDFEKKYKGISFLPNIDKWIWYPDQVTEDKFKTIFLHKSFQLTEVQLIESAQLIVTADEKYSLQINDDPISQSDDKIFSWTRPAVSDVRRNLKEGQNILKVTGYNSYVEKPGFLLRLEIIYRSGELVIISTDKSWLTSYESGDTNLVSAQVVAVAGEKPWRIPEADLRVNPAVYFQKTFNTQSKVKHAFIYCSALGLFHLIVNDTIVGEHKLSTLWSDFNKRAFYNTYDVTSYLNTPGVNIIKAILADGYYAGYCGWEKGRGYYGKYPALKLQLIVTYDDDSNETIVTDEGWISSEGPIREADILMGETYDSNWQNRKDIQQKPAKIVIKQTELTAHDADYIKIRKELRPFQINKIDEQKCIIDFGQNFAGIVRLKIHNQKNKIILRFAEVLNDDGLLYVDNIRMARATDIYIPEGLDEEIWEPLFTYHGFRYVEVTGINEVTEETVTGISINSLSEQTGYIKSSNEKLNKLFECILWNQRSNYIDIPTDCPQRDERFGWTGDAVSYFRTAAFNYDVSAFYTKWFRDLFDSQRDDGALPPFAPLPEMGVGPVYFNAAGWADAGIIAPYTFYQFYSDKALLRKYYPQMKFFMDSITKQCKAFMFDNYGYGDWLCLGEETSKNLVAITYFAYDSSLMNEIASILGFSEDSRFYADLFIKIKKSFRSMFLDQYGSLKQPTQTAAVLAIYFKLLEQDEKQKAADFLVKDIIANKFHLTTGFLGLSFIMPVLSSLNRNDIAWKVLTNDEYPSWFYMIDHGATTLWERWDSYHHDKGFFDPTMNSFNHCSLGCIGEWLYTGLAGINALEHGFKKIMIKPYFPDDLSRLDVSFKSVYGFIKLSWKREDDHYAISITIPFNTTASIILPLTGIKEVGAGTYEFQFPTT